jgi:hypothetical protein
MPNDVDIIPRILEKFASEPGLTVQLGLVGGFTDVSGFAGAMSESQAFGTTLQTSTQAAMTYLTDVAQGVEAIKTGAIKIAGTYDFMEHQITQALRDVTVRTEGPPDVATELYGTPDPAQDTVPPPAAPAGPDPGKPRFS